MDRQYDFSTVSLALDRLPQFYASRLPGPLGPVLVGETPPHPMYLTAIRLAVALSLSLLGSAICQDFLHLPAKEGPGKGKRVVLIAGDEEYRSEEGLPMLAKILSQRHGFECTVLFSADPDGTIRPGKQDSLTNPAALDQADAIVLLTRFRKWPAEAMEKFDAAYLRGVPIIGLRTGTHAFAGLKEPWTKYNNGAKGEWEGGFGRFVLGEKWVAHHGAHKKEGTRGIVEPSAKDDPLLRGVDDVFGDSDVYTANPPADAKILMRGQVTETLAPDSKPVAGKKNDPMQPIAWTRLHRNAAGKTNRIFCTTMGAATDLLSEGLRRLVVNGVYWGLELDVPAKADVTFVDEYVPSFYAGGGERKGLKVSDLGLGKGLPQRADDPKPAAAAPKPAVKAPPLPPSAVPLQFIQGEKIALVGGSFGDAVGRTGDFEAMLHSRFPKSELVIRNFCRPADAVDIRQRPANYTTIDDPLAVFGPDTFFCFFGYNESFAGAEGVEKFKASYEKFLDEYASTYPRSGGVAPRFVIVSPAAVEPANDGFLPDGKAQNANLALYAKAAAEVAKKRGLAFIDLFPSTSALLEQQPGLQFTTDGALLNAAGAREVAQMLDRSLFETTNPAKIGSPDFEKLRAAAADKAWVHAQDYRMLNGWYVYGGRRTHDTETFPREFAKIRAMAAVRDRYVWDIAQGKPVPPQPDDSQTGELFVPNTMFGTQPKKEPKELVYPTPEESIATMQVPEGFEVQLVASEREIPALANVNQVNIDNRGRVWVSCMANYPQWKPGDPRPSDRLIILDDLDPKTGLAGKSTVFYDKLICPTGFEFWNGGVIVVDEPRLIWLKDTDGDDKADVEVVLSEGWATDDTHHTIGAFEWSPGGLLHMLEGVSMSTAVETPWGPLRRSGKPGCYVFDPRSRSVRHFVTPGYGNPWCYVFDQWGQGIVGDGTTPQQHWDTPLSGAPIANRKGLNTVLGNADGMRPNVGTEWILTRQFPDNWQGAFIFACVINMNGLTTFSVEDDGAGFTGGRRTKLVEDQKAPEDLLFAQDNMSFRPTDPQIGADGALYFGDWCAALIGHMQYSQRDPNRDHTHGRVYRLVYKDKPLLSPVTQFGKTVPQLLEQLREYEPRTRYRARRELRDRPTAEVLAAIQALTAKLPAQDKDHDRLLLECLWVQQGHHAVDPSLLSKVLRAATPEARAAATRVLADEWTRILNAMELIKAQVTDDFARTRCEAIRALSFVPTKQAVETVLLAVDLPRDYWIDYTLEATLNALESVWKPLLTANGIAVNHPAGRELLVEVEAASKPGGAAALALKRFLAKPDMPEQERHKITAEIAKTGGNADNGKAVFRRICIACHKWGAEGIEYGPTIDGLAARMKREDVVESILEPNAKLAPEYITTTIETKAGGAFVGFIASETPEAVTLKVAGGLTQEIKVADIAKRENLKVSSMPEGLANTMTPGEFLDLIEFLSPSRRGRR
jgi:putative heme-binding domain-containing protein